MPRRLWRLICLLVICIIITASLAGCGGEKKSNPGDKKNNEVSGATEPKESPQEGFLAPGFSLQDLNGRSISLKDFKGRVVLLNFWATWCGPCRMEIPALKRLYELRKGQNFEIVAVSLDKGSVSKVSSFVTNNQMNFPVLWDQQGEVGGEKYWVRAIPTSFLVDKKGMIRWKVVGGKEWSGADVLKKIDQLSAE